MTTTAPAGTARPMPLASAGTPRTSTLWRQAQVLARRSLTDPTEIAYYVCYGRVGTRLRDLARVAGARWQVEECFQAAKNECGLDHYQVRRYDAWYRHITLAMAALAALTAIRASELSKGATILDKPA